MKRPALIATLILAGALLGIAVAWLTGPGAPPEQPGARGGDFTLTAAEGPVALDALRGRVVLVYFGYASCPDICPTSLALITTALNTLTPAEVERVRVLFISLDPERDTPVKLRQYAGYFHPNITGITGRPEVLADVAARYGAAYRMTPVQSAAGYVVDHTSVTSVVAPDGRLVEQLAHGTPPAEIIAAIRRWLAR